MKSFSTVWRIATRALGLPEEHGYAVAAAMVIWALSLVPLWSVHNLPLYDAPNQLAQVASWLRFSDPSWGLSAHYRLQLLPVPYYGFLAPTWLLGHVFPVAVAAKLWLSVLAALGPLGAVAMARQFGRSPGLAFFTLPLLFNFNLVMGFLAFHAGITLLPFVLVAVDRFVARPSLKSALAISLLAPALYFCHPLPWLFFGVAALALALCRRPGLRQIWLGGLLLPSLGLALWGWSAAQGKAAVDAGAVTIAGDWPPLLTRLSTLPSRLLGGWSTDGVAWMTVVLGGIWLIVIMTARTDEADSVAGKDGWPYRLELIFGLAVLCALILPESLTHPVGWTMIASRFWAVAALFAALLPHGPIVGNRVLLIVAVAVIAAWYPIRLRRAWVGFDHRAASLRKVLTQIPRGKSTLTVRFEPPPDEDLPAVPDIWDHLHAWPQLAAGGVDPFGHTNGLPLIPLVPPLPLADPKQPALPPPGERERYDYVLVQDERRGLPLFGPDGAQIATLVSESGEFRLYLLRKGEP